MPILKENFSEKKWKHRLPTESRQELSKILDPYESLWTEHSEHWDRTDILGLLLKMYWLLEHEQSNLRHNTGSFTHLQKL